MACGGPGPDNCGTCLGGLPRTGSCRAARGPAWAGNLRARQADRVSRFRLECGNLEDSAECSSANLRRHDLSYWHQTLAGLAVRRAARSMFERFTERARRVVVLAQEEARLLNHNYIGTEHILLGLVREGEGVAARALESLGISQDAVRQQVEQIIDRK